MQDHIFVESRTVTAGEDTAGLRVQCGFQPSAVEILNRTTGAVTKWNKGMPAASRFTLSTEAVAAAYAASGGITSQPGDRDYAPGFTLDQGLCTSTQVLDITAWR